MVENIVVTGMGVQVPGARHISAFKDLLWQKERPLQLVKNIGTKKNPHLVMGVIDGPILEGQQFKRHSRVSKLAVAAASEAVKIAGLKKDDQRRLSVIFGTSVAGLTELEQLSTLAASHDFRNYPISGVSDGNIGSVSLAVGTYLQANHLQLVLGNTCTASTDAIALGKQLLEQNLTDVCVVGGAEAPINRTLVYAFSKMKALSTEQDIKLAGMPFSRSDKGFVISEGAGALVLERESDARHRGAAPLGRIQESYSNHDNLSILESDKTGEKMSIVLENICREYKPDYISSQALGLMENDIIEAIAHKHCFSADTPITTIKGLIGHTFAASGVIQAIAAIISMQEEFIPATVGTDMNGFEHVPVVLENWKKLVQSVAITSHGFGGSNTGLLLTREYEL